jgi:hypothetical protein
MEMMNMNCPFRERKNTPVYGWMRCRLYVPAKADIGRRFKCYINKPLNAEELQEEFPILERRVSQGSLTRGTRYGGYDGYSQETIWLDDYCEGRLIPREEPFDWKRQVEQLPLENGQINVRRVNPERLEEVKIKVGESPSAENLELYLPPFFWTDYDFESRSFENGTVHVGSAGAFSWDSEIQTTDSDLGKNWGRWEEWARWVPTPGKKKSYHLFPLAILMSGSSGNLDKLEEWLGLHI